METRTRRILLMRPLLQAAVIGVLVVSLAGCQALRWPWQALPWPRPPTT